MACAAECNAGSECQSGCCIALDNGGAVCGPPEFCDPLPTGSPCSDNYQCASDMCIGWCTEYCSYDYQCPGDTWCVENSSGSQLCFPGCANGWDCSDYSGTSCYDVYTTSDYYTDVCSG